MDFTYMGEGNGGLKGSPKHLEDPIVILTHSSSLISIVLLHSLTLLSLDATNAHLYPFTKRFSDTFVAHESYIHGKNLH